MEKKLWEPTDEAVEKSNMAGFMDHLVRTRGVIFDDYSGLYEWSIKERADFWESFHEYSGILRSKGHVDVLTNGGDMLESKWFRGSLMNYAQNLLRYRDEQPAIIFRGEGGESEASRTTYAELYREVSGLSRTLREMGIGPGDRVVGFMPNIPQTVVAMLAASSIGAIWSSCSPDFGFQGVMDRFGQIEPRVLFTADGYRYNGKGFDSLSKVKEIEEALLSIESIVVVPYLERSPDISALEKGILYGELFQPSDDEIDFEQLPFDHPLFILYTSGTTGVPKCMVHGAGGTLIQHLKEQMLHGDLRREDRIFYFTTCGWMMWNWLVSALAVGATVMLFDGSPFYPDSGELWRYAEEERITVFGTSAKYITALEKDGRLPGKEFDLSDLRAVLSTGSPLSVDNFDYVYRDIKCDLMLSSISGGSDIISCFALGNPVLPVWRGELQCRGLGMAVEVFDDGGNSLIEENGELVCTRSFPSQPVYFWNDPGKMRYRSAYFETYPGIWHHGDFARITRHGGMVIHGRSDATLNPGGVRIGTAEIYRPVEAVEEVVDSLVIGQQWGDDMRVILFLKMAEGAVLTDELKDRIRTDIRKNATPRHVPAKIIEVEDIPYTISGKKVELAVKRILEGKEVLNRDALKNPGSLDHFIGIPELRE